MSKSSCLSHVQRVQLIRCFLEMADKNSAIPHTVSEISAKVAERIGREISDMTTRQYLRDLGFTWKRTDVKRDRGSKRPERLRELAKVVSRIMELCGINDTECLETVNKILSHKALSPTRCSTQKPLMNLLEVE